MRALEAILGLQVTAPKGIRSETALAKSGCCGGHVVSIREQALIAWGYDADLVVLHHEDGFALIWNSANRPLHHLGYDCTQHSARKVSRCSKNLATRHPHQEL